jgi:Tfp pilus assembly protein PilO
MKKSTPAAAPKPSRAWMILGIVLASACAYLLLIFVPGQRATAALRAEHERQQQFVLSSGALDAKIAAAEAELAQAEAFRDAWHEASSSEARLAHVFVRLTEHADAAGAEIMRFEPQGGETFDYLRRVPVEMALEGSFHQIFDFVHRIETLDAVVWIEGLRIEPLAADPRRVRCELKLALFAGAREISD